MYERNRTTQKSRGFKKKKVVVQYSGTTENHMGGLNGGFQ